MPGTLRIGLGHANPDNHENLLAEVRFGNDAPMHDAARCWSLGLPILNPSAGVERWFVDAPVEDIALHGFAGAQCPDWAWIGTHHTCTSTTDVSAVAHDLFTRLHAACAALGKPHVARLWIIIPDIHHGDGDEERYKLFCSGRQKAYDTLDMRAPHFPAATVIGSADGPLRMHALLSPQAGQAVENPRQTAAYEYPRNYGPASPAFSRAMSLRQRFFVSGTAAICGSDSQHAGDLDAQLRAIDENLRALCGPQEANSPWYQHAQYGRIYLRNAVHVDAPMRQIYSLWPEARPWPILQGDICREELLCEVETAL